MKKLILCLLAIFITSTFLCSCDPYYDQYPYRRGAAIWRSDKYQACMYVDPEGIQLQDIGTITVDNQTIDVVYLFVWGQLHIMHYRGDDVESDMYSADLDCLCWGDVEYSSDNLSFSLKITESYDNNIPVGTVITFSKTDEPIYPTGSLEARLSHKLSVNDTAEIELDYPNSSGTVVIGWKDAKVEILSGEDVVNVAGLSVTALKSGKAAVRVSVTGEISEESKKNGCEEKTYSYEFVIVVD